VAFDRRLLEMKLFALVALVPLVAGVAQPVRVTVTGVAYDSLRGAWLAGAFVAMSGTARSVLTDADGRFKFDSVTPGSYTFTMQHDALDSIGVPVVSTRVTVTDGAQSVVIAGPSFTTLWQRMCGDRTVPRDSGLVLGAVRRGPTPAANALIVATWIEVAYDKQHGVTQRRWKSEVRTSAQGGYVVCGTPADVAARLKASVDGATSGEIDVYPSEQRVQRRDLVLGAAERGTIVGVVLGAGNLPTANASVTTDSVAEVRTNADGRFVLRNVPAGTRQIEARAIGLQPVTATAEVVAGDTVSVELSLTKMVRLAPVKVEASTIQRVTVRDYEYRRKLGLGHFRDSSEFGKLETMAGAFDAMNGVTVTRGPGSRFNLALGHGNQGCRANIFVDRMLMDGFDLSLLRPAEIAAIEVYLPNFTPVEFMQPRARRIVGEGPGCGAVVVWTKRAFP
jgi:hypothetical protein